MKNTILSLAVAWVGLAGATEYYADDKAGNDAADGKSPASAWQSLQKVNAAKFAPGDRVMFRRGGLWRGALRPQSGAEGNRLVYTNYGAGPKPILQNSVDRSSPDFWKPLQPGLWVSQDAVYGRDAGILIFNDGEDCGIKRWGIGELKNPKDFWYDEDAKRIVIRLDRNPGETFRSIEVALSGHIVNQGSCHDVTYDGFTVRYTGCHGFGGGSTRNITIRNCDIYWIGGGLQFWGDKKNRKGPVRFGNGIEFWGECHGNLVERCRLWQIYDAALTNQTRDSPLPEADVTYRDNVVWDSEYSFEYWNHEIKSSTSNILFEHNTCIDAGYGLGHLQRPNRNGTHLMFFENPAKTTNFVVRNNVFVRSKDHAVWMCDDWRAKPGVRDGLQMYGNLWFDEGRFYDLVHRGYWKLPINPTKDATYESGPAEFAKYQSETGLDRGSVWGLPQFENEARRDYRLKAGSIGKGAAPDGTDLGARNMPGLDQDQSEMKNEE